MTGEIAFVQADEFGLDDFGEMLAVAGVNFFLRPSRDSCCDVLSIHPHPNKGSDEFAKLFAVAKPEGIRVPERLTNGGVASGRSLIGPHEDVLEKVDAAITLAGIELANRIRKRQQFSFGLCRPRPAWEQRCRV